MRVAVYGTLRKEGRNHGLISGLKYLGSFESNPEYEMRSIGVFPGIKKYGNTSIYLEVFEVDMNTLKRLDELEGYKGYNNERNYYDRQIIITPWGRTLIYFFKPEFKTANPIIKSGNWIEYLKTKNIENYP